MTRAAKLTFGVLAAGVAYAFCLWFFIWTLSPSSFPEALSILLAAPPIIAGWIAFRRNPDGRWWIMPTIAVVVTAAVILAAIVVTVSGSHEL